jgi:hypothetical protein
VETNRLACLSDMSAWFVTLPGRRWKRVFHRPEVLLGRQAMVIVGFILLAAAAVVAVALVVQNPPAP